MYYCESRVCSLFFCSEFEGPERRVLSHKILWITRVEFLPLPRYSLIDKRLRKKESSLRGVAVRPGVNVYGCRCWGFRGFAVSSIGAIPCLNRWHEETRKNDIRIHQCQLDVVLSESLKIWVFILAQIRFVFIIGKVYMLELFACVRLLYTAHIFYLSKQRHAL